MAKLDIGAVTSDKAFVFLWAGKGQGRMQQNALKILKAWKFKRCAEEIIWVKPGMDPLVVESSTLSFFPYDKDKRFSPTSPARSKISMGSETNAFSTSPKTPNTTRSTSSPASRFSSPSSTHLRDSLSSLREEEIKEEDFYLSMHKEHCIIATKGKITCKEA